MFQGIFEEFQSTPVAYSCTPKQLAISSILWKVNTGTIMNLPDDPPPPGGSPPKSALGAFIVAQAGRRKGDGRAPHGTALRRRRLQMARYLRIIAYLREQAGELRAEIASLESIIGAQAEAINALRRRRNGPEE